MFMLFLLNDHLAIATTLIGGYLQSLHRIYFRYVTPLLAKLNVGEFGKNPHYYVIETRLIFMYCLNGIVDVIYLQIGTALVIDLVYNKGYIDCLCLHHTVWYKGGFMTDTCTKICHSLSYHLIEVIAPKGRSLMRNINTRTSARIHET